MPQVVRRFARDPRLVVLPVIGLFVGVIAGMFFADARSVPDVAIAAPIRPPAVTEPSERTKPKPERVARPVGIEIPAIDVKAKIVEVGLNADGSMEVPEFGLAGWYTEGPMPGQPGPSVVVAHVDSRAGPDVFYRLRELKRGDRITIRGADGRARHWVMDSAEQTPKDDLPIERIWNPTRRPVLRLVTCGGRFNTATRHYEDNVIVYAQPAKPV